MGIGLAIADAWCVGAGGAAPAFPFDVAGLMAWYRADKGITTVGGRVSAWNDSSGVGDANRNLTQATAGFRPTFNASDAAFNSQPTMSFARADPDFLSPVGAWSSAIVQPVTIYSVHLVTDLSVLVTYYDDRVVNGSFGLIQTLGGGFNSRAGANLGGSDNTLNKPVVYATVFNGASSSVYDNAQTAFASGNVGTNGSTGLILGVAAGFGSGLQGTIGEVLVYSGAHVAAQRNSRFAALGTRYNITIGP